jgi:hypothetical protein
MPAKKATKKAAGKKAGKKAGARAGASASAAARLKSTDVKRLGQRIKINDLGQTVGNAVTRALASQTDDALRRGIIICGIIYDLKNKSFKTVVQEQGF